MPSGDTAGESLFLPAVGRRTREKEISEFPPNKRNLDRPRVIAEMPRGANGVCATGKALVAPCNEMSCVADALKQRMRQRRSLC